MAIRHGLLALLDEGPAYGYQLKAAFEERTGGTWLLNIGQVYTTLARAERDGLVAALEADDEGRVVYEITRTGSDEVARWFAEPVRRDGAPRDELTIKLAVAVMAPGVDVGALVQAQRAETMRTLQSLTRLKMDADVEGDTAWLLVLERLLFDAEAEARWLDHVEARLRRAAQRRTGTRTHDRTASAGRTRAERGTAR